MYSKLMIKLGRSRHVQRIHVCHNLCAQVTNVYSQNDHWITWEGSRVFKELNFLVVVEQIESLYSFKDWQNWLVPTRLYSYIAFIWWTPVSFKLNNLLSNPKDVFIILFENTYVQGEDCFFKKKKKLFQKFLNFSGIHVLYVLLIFRFIVVAWSVLLVLDARCKEIL